MGKLVREVGKGRELDQSVYFSLFLTFISFHSPLTDWSTFHILLSIHISSAFVVSSYLTPISPIYRRGSTHINKSFLKILAT